MITKAQLDYMLKNKHVTVETNIIKPLTTGKITIEDLNKESKDRNDNAKESIKALVKSGMILKFTVPGIPVSCPRMTQRDKWMKRPCVMRYREYSDRLRKFVNLHDLYVGKVTAKFHMPMPESWSLKKIQFMAGHPHRQRGDLDNMVKSILDSLMKEDGMVWSVYAEKYWAQPGKERTELTFEA